MAPRATSGVILLALPFALLHCAEAPEASPAASGPQLAIDVAALSLEGVGDVIWDLEVVNGRAPTPDVVWQRRISSSGYGDGAGSASYVGPCDADPAVSTNTVRVWVVGVYADTLTSLGSFASGAANGATGDAVPFQNPTATAPLERTVVCPQNADVAVQFDVALMRPAQQGFFDIAVNFDNIFCSAKFDCCTETTDGSACASDITLLFAPGGGRATTLVLGFACTAGPQTGVETQLYLDDLALDCSSPSASDFAPDFLIDPSGAAGNQCAAGAVGGGACDAVTSPGALSADAYLYQVGLYRGVEQLQSGGAPANKVYWNVALGAKRKVAAGAGIEDCRLRTAGTAADANDTTLVDQGAIAAGAVYPFVQWDVDLAACKAEPLTFGSPTAMVRPVYTGTSGGATTFGYAYGPSLPAGPVACGDGVVDPGEDCDDGNRAAGDGCGAACDVEPNMACAGEPSVCTCTLPGDFHWVSWTNLSGATATGDVGGTAVSYASNAGIETSTFLANHAHFPVIYGVPNANPTIKNRFATTNTLTFASPVTQPTLLFASVGSAVLPVTVTFDQPIEIVWSNQLPSGSITTTATSFTGYEANVIVRVPGVHSAVSFSYGTFENYVNFAFGFNAPDPACPAP